MSYSSNKNKSEILGMPFGTVCSRLRKIILFHLAQKLGENICFKCSNSILSVEEFSIEHKEAWQQKGAEYFWDTNNIAFSHISCNLRTGWVKRDVVNGKLWCSKCKQYLPIENFHKESRNRTGYAFICKSCSNAKRRKIIAQGDCNHCGAKRGTKPFRLRHNLCIACANKSYKEISKQIKLTANRES